MTDANADTATAPVALITGGARGIGRGIALSLADDGWRVAICYRTSADAAEETCQEIDARGGEGLSVQADVSDPEAGEAFVEQVHSAWGRIDAFIHCAGPYHRVRLFQESLEGWHSMFDNNLHSLFYLSRAIVPIMRAQKYGRIITFSMANAHRLQSNPMVTAHYIAKVGVLVLTRSIAKATARDGITANTISPGFLDSGSAPAEELERMKKRIPAKRIGDVDDAVAATRFLLSDEASYITANDIQVSGGWGL